MSLLGFLLARPRSGADSRLLSAGSVCRSRLWMRYRYNAVLVLGAGLFFENGARSAGETGFSCSVGPLCLQFRDDPTSDLDDALYHPGLLLFLFFFALSALLRIPSLHSRVTFFYFVFAYGTLLIPGYNKFCEQLGAAVAYAPYQRISYS